LPVGSLEKNTGDSVYQGDPRIAVHIADVVTSPPALPGSSSAAYALGKLLGSDPVSLRSSVCTRWAT